MTTETLKRRKSAKRTQMKLIDLYVPAKWLEVIDELVYYGYFRNRSEAIRTAIYVHLVDRLSGWLEGEKRRNQQHDYARSVRQKSP